MIRALRALVVGVVALGVGVPVVVHAAPTEQASEQFHRGLELYRRGQYEGARVAFEEAYRILPNVRVTANIAACLARLGRNAEAVRTYERYLAEGGVLLEPAARSAARQELERLRGLVAELRITVDPADAEILVDGVAVGRAPLEGPVAVEPGSRTLAVRAEGHLPFTRVVEAEAGQEVNVSVVLQAPAAEGTPQDHGDVGVGDDGSSRGDGTGWMRRPRVRHAGRGPLPWVALSAAGVLAIAATTTGLLALSGASEYQDPGTSIARRRELYGPTNDLALATDVLLATAGVAAVVAAVLFLTGPSGDASEEPPLALGPAGLSGRF